MGNGVTNWTLDCDNAYKAMSFWHNLIDINLESELVENNCLEPALTIKDYGENGKRNDKECERLKYEWEKEIAKINIYDVYRHCYYADDPVTLLGTTPSGQTYK